jgi:hypothetical protein
VEYALMIRLYHPQNKLFVNVTEVARCFREEPCSGPGYPAQSEILSEAQHWTD